MRKPSIEALVEGMTSSLERRYNSMTKDKVALLNDPKKLDEYTGQIFQELSPSPRAADKKKGALLTDRVDMMIDSDHPLKGFGAEFKSLMQKELADPRNAGYPLHEISSGVQRHLLSMKDEKGVSRLERTYRLKHLEDSELFWGQDLKAPAVPLGMPDYGTWRDARIKAEKAAAKEEFHNADDFMKTLAISTWAGTSLGAGFGASGGPLGALVGAGAGAVGGLVGASIDKLAEGFLEKFDFVRSKRYSDRTWDKVKHFGITAAPGMIAGVGAEEVLRRGAMKALRPGTDFILKGGPYGDPDKVVLRKPRVIKHGEVVPYRGGPGGPDGPIPPDGMGPPGRLPNFGDIARRGEDVVDLRNPTVIRHTAGELALPQKQIEYWQGRIPYLHERLSSDAVETIAMGRMASRAALAKPTVARIVYAKELEKQATKIAKKSPAGAAKEMAESGQAVPGSPTQTLKGARAVVSSLLGPEQQQKALVLNAAKRLRQIKDNKLVLEAMEDGEGILAGIEKALLKQDALDFYTGRKTAETLLSKVDTESGLKALHRSALTREADDIAKTMKPEDAGVITLDDLKTPYDAGAEIAEVDKQYFKLKDALESEYKKTTSPKELERIAGEMTKLDARYGSKLAEIRKKVNPTGSSAEVIPFKATESLTADPVARDILDATTTPTGTIKQTTEDASDIFEMESYDSGVINFFGDEGLTTAEAKEAGKFWAVNPIKQNARQVFEEAKGKSLGEVYSAIDQLHEKLLKKYYPKVNLFPRTEEGLATMMKAVNQLPKKLTSRETSVLDTLIDVHDEMIETAYRAAKKTTDRATASKEAMDVAISADAQLSPIQSLDQLIDEGRALARLEAKGSITPSEVYEQLKRMEKQVGKSTAPPDELREMFSILAQAMNKYSAKSGVMKFLAAFGVGAGVFDLFGMQDNSTVEAGIIPMGLFKSGVKVAARALEGRTMAFMQAAKQSGVAVDDIMSKTKFFLRDTEFQRGLGNTASGGPEKILRDTSKILKRTDLPLIMKAMGPYQKLNYLFNVGKEGMNNPAVFAASYMSAEYRNIRNALTVFDNIFKDSGLRTASKLVKKAMDPVADLQINQIGYDYWFKKAEELGKQIGKLQGKKGDEYIEDVMQLRREYGIAKENIKKFGPAMKEFHRKWEEAILPLAKEQRGVRLFLAADDTAQFEKYPFLKSMEFTADDRALIGRYRMQMAEYAKRLKANGMRYRKGPFVHYALHPKINNKMVEKLIGAKGIAPYMKQYSRSLNARPLMPDLPYATARYVPDIERRIQTQAWWRSGWDKVYRKLSVHTDVRDAFDQLLKGRRPFEGTFGNKAALLYSSLETVNRLFMTPSAGLKHIVKVTGDMATLGPGEVTASLPSAVKGTSWRIMDFNPRVRGFLGKIGIKSSSSEYAKLRKSTFNSIVPTMDTHYRLSQMGMNFDEDLFDKANKLFNSVNHVGSVWITMAELFDRGVSFEAAMRMAAKRGMTADQALYGIYDTILKNNFLGREFTPNWLRHPKMKALLLFQTTPFKIMERRVVNAVKASNVIRNMGKSVYNATKTAEGRVELLSDLRNMRAYMKGAEAEFKSNMFIDALRSEQDFFGTNVVQQFARDIAIMGAGTIGGASVGVNLTHHFFHAPFLKNHSFYSDREGATLALSPAAEAAFNTSKHYFEGGERPEEFIGKYFIDRWLGKSGPVPDIFHKINRLNKNDIPEIYQDSKFKYLFSIPSEH